MSHHAPPLHADVGTEASRLGGGPTAEKPLGNFPALPSTNDLLSSMYRNWNAATTPEQDFFSTLWDDPAGPSEGKLLGPRDSGGGGNWNSQQILDDSNPDNAPGEAAADFALSRMTEEAAPNDDGQGWSLPALTPKIGEQM